MDVFAEDFSMVTTAAVVVDRAQVEQLFKGAVGVRPSHDRHQRPAYDLA